jgi:Eco57I restriction-modification methylase
MNKALIDSIRKDLDALHVGDSVKNVYAPFETLGADMVSRLPSVQGEILVVSDAGLLVSVLQRLRRERLPFSKVQFLCHTEALQNFGSRLGVRTTLVCYNQLNDWFKKADMGMKFDVVIGNPPYQNGGDAGNFVLWPLFIMSATNAIVDGGHLLFVVPQTWCTNLKIAKARSKASSLVRSDALSHGTLRFADFSIGEFFPGIASTFSMIDWVKKHTGQETKVKTPQGSFAIDYTTADWLPCLGDERTISILQKTIWGSSKKMELLNGGAETAGFRFGRDTISKERSATFKHKIANTSAQYTRGQFLYSSVEHPNQYDSKVVFSDSGYAAPFFDNGEVGLGHHARAFVATLETSAAIISMLNSKIVAFAAKAYLSGTASSAVSLVMDSIPMIPMAMSDQELYAHFGLTQSEIDLIERTVK